MGAGLARITTLLFVISVVFPCLAQSPDARNSADAQSTIAGIWRGNSTCMVKGSPCHDETNVYRISPVAGKPGMVTVDGSKVLDGREIVMGTSSDWKYDAQKHTLDSSNGAIHFTIDGNKMEGELKLQDGTLYRVIHLKKDESSPTRN